MQLHELTEDDSKLLYEGSDPEAREGWNIIIENRFYSLIGRLAEAGNDPKKVFAFVESKAASVHVQELIKQAANNE